MRTTLASALPVCLVGGLLLTTQASAQPVGLTLGAALGTSWDGSGSTLLVTAQAPIARHVVTELELTRQANATPTFFHVSHSFVPALSGPLTAAVTAVSANVLLRGGPARLLGFIGGGFSYGVESGPFGGGENFSGTQLLGGFDLPIGRRLTPFGELRLTTRPNEEVRVFGGLRVTLVPSATVEAPAVALRPATRGDEIRIVDVDGTQRTGRFRSLSGGTLAFAQSGQVISLPVSAIERVERVSHAARYGAVTGGLIGSALLAAAFTGDCADCEDRDIALVLPAIGVGLGVAIGAMINVAGAEGRTLFRRGSTGTPVIAPIVAPSRVGVTIRIPLRSRT